MIEMLLLLLSGGFLMLRLGSAGSFPKPLKPEEEEKYVRLWVEEENVSRASWEKYWKQRMNANRIR